MKGMSRTSACALFGLLLASYYPYTVGANENFPEIKWPRVTKKQAEVCLAPWQRSVTNRAAGILAGIGWGGSSRVDLHTFHDGILVPLSRPRNMVVCLVQKSSSSIWKLLLSHVAGKQYLGGIRAPRTIHSRSHIPGSAMTKDEARYYISDPESPRILISRDPYSRWLSAYLDKITGNPNVFLRCCMMPSAEVFGKRLGPNRQDFELFTRKFFEFYVEKLAKKPRKQCGMEPHFAPQTCRCGLRGGFQFDYILRLEDMGSWYPGLIKMLGLEMYVEKGWAKNAKKGQETDTDCFYRIPGLTCNQTTERIHQPCRNQPTTGGLWRLLGLSGSQPQQNPGMGETGLARATTGASRKVAAFYQSADVVEIVNRLFADDFRILGYPRMDKTKLTKS